MKFFLAVASLFFAAQIALANEEYADNTLGDPGAKIMLARAIEGDGDAILKVAVAYAAGDKGFPKNLNKAVLWWKKGADMGDAHSQNYLASAYLKGEGVEKNAERAIELWRKAAKLELPDAQYNLGVCAARGIGTSPPSAESFGWKRPQIWEIPRPRQSLRAIYLTG